mgnify:CR=1 FL=1
MHSKTGCGCHGGAQEDGKGFCKDSYSSDRNQVSFGVSCLIVGNHNLTFLLRIFDGDHTAKLNVLEFNDMNEKLLEEGKQPAEGKQVMLGITKASLAAYPAPLEAPDHHRQIR